MLPFTKSVVLALCLCHVTAAALVNLHKRSSTPSTVKIPLMFSSSGFYTASVAMSKTNVQNFNFGFSTGTGMTAVAGTNCTSCVSTNLYNQSASSTASSMNASDSVSLADASYTGQVIKEDCSLKTSNGSSWNYNNQTIVVANAASTFQNGMSGLVGLGTNSYAGTQPGTNYTPQFSDSIYSQWLENNQDMSQLSFGMNLARPIATPKNASTSPSYSGDTDAGTLDWLSPDQDSYVASQLATKSVQSLSDVTYAVNSSSQPDWTVELDGWSFKSASAQVSNSQAMVTSLDLYYPDIYFPQSQAKLLNDAIPGSSYDVSLSTLGNESAAWTIPCDAQYSLTIDVNGQEFTLDQSVLTINIGNGACTSAIEGFTDASVEQYILGAIFLSQVYVIFTVERNGTDTVSIAPRSTTSSTNHTGAIVGGTVGGVAGVLLIALAALFFMRRRRTSGVRELRTAMLADEHKPATAAVVEPYTIGAATAAASPPPQPQQALLPQERRETLYSEPTSPTTASLLLPSTAISSMFEHDDDDALPPAYEATESGRSSVGGPPRVRSAKGEYVRPLQPTNAGPGSPSQPHFPAIAEADP